MYEEGERSGSHNSSYIKSQTRPPLWLLQRSISDTHPVSAVTYRKVVTYAQRIHHVAQTPLIGVLPFDKRQRGLTFQK